jgi:hypothetical protein
MRETYLRHGLLFDGGDYLSPEELPEGLRAAFLAGRAVELWEDDDRLDALWLQGVGLDRTELPDHVQRRAALLEYWSSRADTLEGRAVTRALEIFLREVVATSAHPFTVEEIAQAESRREDGRRLDLPVEQGTIRVLTDPEAPNGP